MDKIINKDGIEFLRWTDNNGNIREAELEQVKLFGKQCFTDEEWNEIINL